MNGKSILAVLTAAGTLSGPVLAQPEGRRGGRDGSRFEAMADYVGLSPAQREQWKTLREAHRKEVEPLRAEGRDLHEKLRAVLEADNPDPAAVGAAMVALKQHREKMKASHEALLGRMKGQLTPAQQEKLAAFEAASKAQRRPHGGPRHRGPFPDEG
jgi:Spy/CpxP family protein refolding chaperone